MTIRLSKLPNVKRCLMHPMYIVPIATLVLICGWYSIHYSGWSEVNFINAVKIFGNDRFDKNVLDNKKPLTLLEAREIALRLTEIYKNLEINLQKRNSPKQSDIAALKQLASDLYPPINMTTELEDQKKEAWYWSKAGDITNVSDPESPLVCPEVYKGPKSTKGWQELNCTTMTSMKELVTIVINTHEFPANGAKDRVVRLLHDFEVAYPGMRIIVLGPSTSINSSLKLAPSVMILNIDTSAKKGISSWSTAVRHVQTPMVFIARDMFYFSKSASPLERLVRVISEIPGVGVAGGAVRNSSRHWKVGCFQTTLRNYVLRYDKGYHHSYKECMFCDYVDGPFLTHTHLLALVVMQSFGAESLLDFQELFLLLSAEWVIMACPDVMFYADAAMAGGAKVLKRETWLPLAIHRELNRVLIAYEHYHVLHKYSCKELDIKCEKKIAGTGSFTIPVCCQEEVARMVAFWDKFCNSHGLANQYDSGTAMGAVKMADMMPWDLDVDACYPDVNYTFVKSAEPLFRKHGFAMTEFTDPKCCDPWYPDRMTRSYLRLWSPGIYTEMWGEWTPLYDRFLHPDIPQNGSLPANIETRIEIHGVWVNGPPNPGQYVRVRYGVECLRHAHSWLQTGKSSSWDPYESGFFKKCIKPNHHACLDKMPTDGSLAFQVPEW